MIQRLSLLGDIGCGRFSLTNRHLSRSAIDWPASTTPNLRAHVSVPLQLGEHHCWSRITESEILVVLRHGVDLWKLEENSMNPIGEHCFL
jgi:hypothetical protein